MIQNIFPIPIYKIKYSGDLGKLQQDVMPRLKEVFETSTADKQYYIQNNGISCFNTNRNLHLMPELSPYLEFLNEHINVYWKYLNYGGKPQIVETWANRYATGSFVSFHNHSPIPIAVVFYLKKSKDSGNIVFGHPNEIILKHQPYSVLGADFDSYSYPNLFDHELDVEDGDIVMFPGWVNHKTKINAASEDKIIIASNVVTVDDV